MATILRRPLRINGNASILIQYFQIVSPTPREAEKMAPEAYLRQLWRTPLSPVSDSNTDIDWDDEPSHTRRSSSHSTESTSPSASPSRIRSQQKEVVKNWKEPQPFEVFRAVERKDIVLLMEIRDRAFHLLVDKNGETTPLVHALRIGQSHRDVAIILLGAFSRYINHLDDESDLQKPRIKNILKNIRFNLKAAIDHDLAISKSDLIASLMQIYVMSEGDKWVRAQTSNVMLALRAGIEGQPVKTAEAAVRKFATRELGKAELIASLEDYVANATSDLLLMAAWTQALESIKGEPIPVSYFARDDRVYKAFVDRVDKNEKVMARSLSRRLKWQIRVLRSALEGRLITYRRKVQILAEELDQGAGV
ncbi:hypothetical protein GYMLUDRAFT_38803 [Collybiopsis luxurians FD-317 M1]|nr:hypothetical protein GYMLUDRAFT_38803 [Collybiopsis luxurians FD-317 M1]